MSQLRVNEFVNSDDNGAPSFPNSATTIPPTESDQFATKLYVDENSTSVTAITNNVSPTEPLSPSVGDFWTDISDLTLITLSIWDGSEWVTVKATQDNPTTQAPGPVPGSIISPPSILDDNSGYIPAMLTAVSANVSDATLASAKWYKDDVEIPGATGLQFYATEIGTYKYEEVWEDTFGNQLFPSLAAVIDARAGVIVSQPTVSSSNGDYIPTVLTATPGVVADAEFAGSQWYKDGAEIPGETGTTLSVSDTGIYMYRESWTDFFSTELLPVISVTIDARTGIIATQPTITSSNGDYIPTVLTSTRADVDHATFAGSKWYKDDVEIPGETGTTLSVSDTGVYKYEEVWIDYFSTEFLPALSATIDARTGIIATQPTITSSNGNYSPATLVATRAHVDNATFVGSKWYRDGVEIPGETGLSITIPATEGGTYTYQEIWTDYFSTEFLPALGASLQVFGEIATPSVLSPADDTGVPDFDYTALSSAIASVDPGTGPGIGSATVFEGRYSNGADYISAAFDSNSNRVVLFYRLQNSSDGTAIVGEISGGTITFGSPVIFDTYDYGSGMVVTAAAFDSTNNKVVVAYRKYESNGNKYHHAKVGTVDPSNNSIEFGAAEVINSNGESSDVKMVFDPSSGKIVVAYRDEGNSNHGTAKVGTITVGSSPSNDTISFGSAISIGDGVSSNLIAMAVDTSNNRIVIASQSLVVYVHAGTVSGNSINFGSPTVVGSNTSSGGVSIAFDESTNKVVVVRTNRSSVTDPYAVYAYVGTVDPNDNSINIGSGQLVAAKGSVEQSGIAYDSGGQKLIIVYKNGNASWQAEYIHATVNPSNDTITFSSATNYDSNNNNYFGVIRGSNGGQCLIFYRHDITKSGTAHVVGLTGFPDPNARILTLTDTTVSKVSDGSLVEGVSIDQALSVGESVKLSGIESYWITTFSHPTNATAEPRGLAVDNAGNIYTAGEESSVDNAAYLAKLNGGGNISWQTSLNYSGSNEAANDVAIDSSNNLYYCGYSQKWDNNGAIIVKYNDSGTLQWQRLLKSTIGSMRAEALAIDSSDNVIVTGYAPILISGNQSYGFLIAKYNSSGVLQWARTLDQEGTGNKNEYGYGIAVDSSDNIYVCGEAGNSGYGSTDCLIAKYDSSGNIQWQKLLGDQYSTTQDRFRSVTVDSSDNIYAIGHSEKPNDNNDTIIAKYDASGNIAWQKYIDNDAQGKAIDTDSSGNVYILSESIRVVGAGNADLYIAKLDSSGNMQWQNTLGGEYNELTFDLCISLDNLYISGTTRSLSSNTYWKTVVAKLPTDGSLVGTHGGLTYQSVSLNIGTSTLQDRISNFRDSAADSSGGGDNSQVNDSVSTLPDQFDPGYTAGITAITGASGTVLAHSSNTITLSDVSGTWSTGMKIEGATIDTKDNPDAVNPYTVSLTSSEPTASAGVILSWSNAEWEVAEDSGFTSNVQSAVSSLTSSGTQVGPTEFAFDGSKNYYVRIKYNSSNPPSVQSEWSPTNMFITGVKATVSLPSIFSPVDGEGVGLPRTYTPKSSAITSIDFDSSWTPPAGISDINHQYLIFSNTNAYDGSTELSQSLTEAFPAGTQLDIPGGGYVSSWTSGPDSSAIMIVRKDEKEINSSTYIDNASVRDTFPQYFDNLYHMPGYGGPHGRYIMTHSNRDTFYSDDGGATIRPLGQIPEEAGAMSSDAFAYNPINQVLIVTKAQTYTGGRLIWYSNNGGASWTKATNTSAGGQRWNKPYFVAFSYDSNGNPTSGEFRVNTSNDNYITGNHARSTDGVNWYPLQGLSSGWPGVGHYYHAAADKCVVMEQRRNGIHLAYGSGTGVSLSSGDLSSMSSFPRESIDGDLEQINQVIYDPYLGKMFMFGGWSPRVWYSDNATHWSRKDLGSISGFNSNSINVINTGSSFLYVMRSGRNWYYTTDPSQNISTWTHETNALEYISSPGYNDMVNKMIVGGTNGSAVGYYSEYGIAGYSAGYSIGDTVSALNSTTLPGLPANAVSPTSSAPTASAGTISSWDYAEWQIATDAAFTQNVQTSTASLSSSGTQSGPSFSYNNGTVYYIRTRYVAADPVGPVSDWSSPIHFQTAP
tara:strand:+ start:6378 stop:12611 length:6234 start_codon:yes stop_codon:yes gene_type:complete